MALFQDLAYLLILGVLAAAYVPALLADRIGFGGHPYASTAIGAVIGIIILLISVKAGVAALIVAAVVSLISSIVLDKIW